MPYRRRLAQLDMTLESYRLWYGDIDYEVVIVEDEIARTLPPMLNCRIFSSGRRDGGNPSPLFNRAARMARYDIFMLTNPECVHMGNLLGAGMQGALEGKYVCFGCLSVAEMPESLSALRDGNPEGEWYQHTGERNKLFHEAAMLSRSTYEKVGGFSEEFGGYGYDDHDFVEKLMAAGVPCVPVDEPHCIHLPHDRFPFEPTNEELFKTKWGYGPRAF